MPPLQLALAIDDAREESALLSMIQERGLRVDGRDCQVRLLCSSVRDVQAAVAGGIVDLVIVASTLNAIPFATLRELARGGRAMVVLAPDPDAGCWDEFPAPVIQSNPDSATLAEALHQALDLGAPARVTRRTSAAVDGPISNRANSQVLAVTSGYAGEGRTTIATALAFALGSAVDTVLVDADMRGGAVEFGLNVDPGRNLCLLAQQEPDTDGALDADLDSELQSMGEPSGHGVVLAGVTKPSLRTWVTPAFFERLIDALRRRFAFVVLDTSGSGWSTDDPAIDRLCLRLADRLMLVVRPDTQGVAVARRAVRQWAKSEHINVILNQTGLAGQYPRGEVEQALGLSVVATVPTDSHGAAGARARHRPVVCQPGCRMAAPLLDLASRVYGGGALELPPDIVASPEQPWWRRRLSFGRVGTEP